MPTLPLFPDSGPAPLVGIARLAAHADPLREGHQIEYFSLPTRSVLNRVTSERRLPFQWAINPYRGCEFACKYLKQNDCGCAGIEWKISRIRRRCGGFCRGSVCGWQAFVGGGNLDEAAALRGGIGLCWDSDTGWWRRRRLASSSARLDSPIQAGYAAIPGRDAGGRMGSSPGSARDGLCHGSGSRGYGLGRGALRSYPHGLHHSSGKCRVDSRGGEVWVS